MGEEPKSSEPEINESFDEDEDYDPSEDTVFIADRYKKTSSEQYIVQDSPKQTNGVTGILSATDSTFPKEWCHRKHKNQKSRKSARKKVGKKFEKLVDKER